ncbi:MAG: hypothetical protein QOJ22_716, partial [Thermoleophilaceae bacterium]|nr:hypothetical protein [Thermoleophilaceae bacterium]
LSELAVWRKSRPGVKAFGYAQTVAGLATGGRYSVRVQYRWLDARGRTIARTKRTSGECRQQGSLPNLEITRLAARPGETSGTSIYSIEVTNSGRGEARDVVIEPFIDGAAADAQRIDLIEPGKTKTVYVTGPTCKRAVRVSVDRAGTVNETNDDDNVLRFRCPLSAE